MSSLAQQLNLSSLSSQLPTLLEEARQQQLSYEAFLESVLGSELRARQERAFERRQREARLPFAARLERFDFRFQPSVSERLMRECDQCGVCGTTRGGQDPPGLFAGDSRT
jgi:DNA replication protein DnaC